MSPQPRPGVLVGITHGTDMVPIIREPRVLKVGIGVPKGRASYVYTHQGRWIVRYGVYNESKLVMETAKGADGKNGFASRQECEAWYAKNKQSFAVSKYPQRIPFFTFTRRTVTDVKGKTEENFEPDFAAIEAHGDTPREVEVVFMSKDPLGGNYQAWSASELKCFGDGVDASRVIQMGNDSWPGWTAANAAGDKRFHVDQCWVSGLCPYSKEGGKDKLVCKPNVSISFQLANSIRLGATAYFVTTSIESTRRLFSSLSVIRSAAEYAGGSIVGIPMRLVLAPFQTNHNNVKATQYAASIEMRDQDVSRIRKALAENSWTARTVGETRLLEASEEEVIDITPRAMAAEFYPEAEMDYEGSDPEDGDAGVGNGSTRAASATADKTAGLRDELNKRTRAPYSRGPKPEEPAAVSPQPVAPLVATQPVVAPQPIVVPPAQPSQELREELGRALEEHVPGPATTGPVVNMAPPSNIPETTRPVMPSTADVAWRKRTRDTFSQYIAPHQYEQILKDLTGFRNEDGITVQNYKDVWTAMQPFRDATEILQKQKLAERAFGGSAGPPDAPLPPEPGKLF